MTTMQPEFTAFSKMARLSRECIITEKIDGTNAQILITDDGQFLTGSRNRWITPEDDNFGFSRWAHENKEQLMLLGPGRHFGEWWGSGIQRGYGLPKGEKRFSLFNVSRWCLAGSAPAVQSKIWDAATKSLKETLQDVLPGCCRLVPILYRGPFSTHEADTIIMLLAQQGSAASPGFMDPEGIVVFHAAGLVGFKKTIKNDESPKSLVA
jgi:hypothetical protein